MIIWYFNPIGICHLSSRKANSIYCMNLIKKPILSSKNFKPPPLSLFLPFLKIAKSQMPFCLFVARHFPFSISLPHCAAGEGTTQHHCFQRLIRLASLFPKPACSSSVAALISSENPQKVLSLVSVMYFNSNLPSNTIFLFLIDWCGVRLTWLIVFLILQLLGLFDFIASPSPSFAIFDSSIVRPLFLVTCSEITDFGFLFLFLFLFFSLCVCILVNSSYGLHE